MNDLIKTDFHIHSNFSDGMFSPEILADELAFSGVAYAALTDHDCIDGLERFEKAAQARQIQCVNGVEMSASRNGQILHLLAYGFDRTHDPLNRELERSYHHLHPGIPRWLDNVRSFWHRCFGRNLPVSSYLIAAQEALPLVHEAGGRVFLAHPLSYYQNDEQFADLLAELKEQGLDGLESYYKQYNEQEVALLLNCAAEHQLLTCSGSDFHGKIRPRLTDPGILVPQTHLQQFRQALDLG